MKSLFLGDIAERLGATLKGDPKLIIRGVSGLDQAGSDHLSFLGNARHADLLARCKAAAVIVSPEFADLDLQLLICERPYLGFARAAQLFWEPPHLAEGVHPSAVVAHDAQLGENVRVGPLAQIGSGCVVGKGSRIYGGVCLARGVRVGEDCLIYPSVTIMDDCVVGNRAVIHSGAVIGADGFGFAQDEKGRHVKIPQTGIVQIDDDVEIGANSTIDRATFGRTWVKSGAKIDDLVMVGHNAVIGEHSILAGQVGVAGSSRVGRHAVLAGQVGIADHVDIGEGARIGAKSGVHRDVEAGAEIIGIPAVPARQFIRNFGNIQRLSQLKDELRELRKRVQQLEEALHGD